MSLSFSDVILWVGNIYQVPLRIHLHGNFSSRGIIYLKSIFGAFYASYCTEVLLQLFVYKTDLNYMSLMCNKIFGSHIIYCTFCG